MLETTIAATLAVLIGLLLGALGSHYARKLGSSRQTKAASSEAARILEQARDQAREFLVQAKEEALQLRAAGEAEVREWRSEVQRMERRVSTREENLERQANSLERRESDLSRKEEEVDRAREEVAKLEGKELEKLEAIANLTLEQAREKVMARAEETIRHDVARRYRDMELRAREGAEQKAREIVAETIQRLASEVVAETTVTTVPLPSDDMKGRLIGREGRNIRAIEKATGVDLIIDDTPEAVTLSCFDPVRREVARVTLGKLIADGRIHPARIEEMAAKAEKEVADIIWKAGEAAAFDVGVHGLHPEVVKLLGRLKFRQSYGENVLQHSIEVARIASMLAGEIGANVKVAKTAGLLHDLGKAMTHEIEGPHAEIGAEAASRHNVSPQVCAAIREHHGDDMSSVEAFLVSAADAVSAARPGARRDTVEHYVKRLEAIEEVCRSFEGVEKCYAIQAGREVRVLVDPDHTDDGAACKLASDVARRIEESLSYPGQIKVIVIRESRAVEYAR